MLERPIENMQLPHNYKKRQEISIVMSARNRPSADNGKYSCLRVTGSVCNHFVAMM